MYDTCAGGSAPASLRDSNDTLRQQILIKFWPVEELPTTFKYNTQDFTYNPEDYGGPVMIFLPGKEAAIASMNVSTTDLNPPVRCLFFQQFHDVPCLILSASRTSDCMILRMCELNRVIVRVALCSYAGYLSLETNT